MPAPTTCTRHRLRRPQPKTVRKCTSAPKKNGQGRPQRSLRACRHTSAQRSLRVSSLLCARAVEAHGAASRRECAAGGTACTTSNPCGAACSAHAATQTNARSSAGFAAPGTLTSAPYAVQMTAPAGAQVMFAPSACAPQRGTHRRCAASLPATRLLHAASYALTTDATLTATPRCRITSAPLAFYYFRP